MTDIFFFDFFTSSMHHFRGVWPCAGGSDVCGVWVNERWFDTFVNGRIRMSAVDLNCCVMCLPSPGQPIEIMYKLINCFGSGLLNRQLYRYSANKKTTFQPNWYGNSIGIRFNPISFVYMYVQPSSVSLTDSHTHTHKHHPNQNRITKTFWMPPALQ